MTHLPRLAGSLLMVGVLAACSTAAAAPTPGAKVTGAVNAGASAAPTSATRPSTASCPAADWSCLRRLAVMSGGLVYGPPQAAEFQIAGTRKVAAATATEPGTILYYLTPLGGDEAFLVGEGGTPLKDPVPPPVAVHGIPVEVNGVRATLILNLPGSARLMWHLATRDITLQVNRPHGAALAVRAELIRIGESFVAYTSNTK
jgi:hypothetical protein